MPNLRLALAAALATLAVTPAAASANATVSQLGGVVTVASTTANENNRIAMSLDGTVLRIEERGKQPQGLDNSSLVTCRKESSAPKVVFCNTANTGLTSIVVRLGLGDDILDPLAAKVPVNATGESGDDTIAGGDGVDELDGGPDDDTVRGGGGNDTLAGGEGSGADRVFGEAGDDEVNGGEGSDPELSGGAGTDEVLGAPGDDRLDGGPGDDRLDGGAGADGVTYEFVTTPVKVALGAGGAETAGNGATATDSAPAENDTIRNVENADGGRGSDQLTGNELGNSLAGRQGNDTVDGAGGDDGLRGTDGADKLLGGPGNDTLDGGGNGDALDGGEGADVSLGGTGNDAITSRDGVPEPQIDCQEGADDELVGDNGADGSANCEAVAPQTVAPATLSGDPVEGAVLTFTRPVVSGGPFSLNRREWMRCAADGSRCVEVPVGADTYKPSQFDVGKILFVRLTVGNAAGRVVEETGRTAPIADVPRSRPPGPAPKPPEPVIPRGPAAEIASAAKAALAARGKRLRLDTGRRVACRDAVRSCSAQLTVTTKVKVKVRRKKGKRAKKKTKTVELGYARYVVKAGKTADLVVTLKKSARKRLKPGRKVVLRLRIEVVQAGSDTVVRKIKVKLKVPRRR